MRLKWNIAWLAMLTALALIGGGCGGINAGGSVSPASFFLPGAMNTAPAATNAPVALSDMSNQLAQAR